tara:strand:+ start:986 stop:1807 length:822 start_codon:yes stop_codon:yes gene_type:complete
MIKINKWWEQFENATSRKLKTIQHFGVNSGNDSRGYRKLMRMGDKGLLAFGTFQSLCQLMAGLSHEARKEGAMMNSDGSPLDLEDIADLTRIEIGTLKESISILQGIDWLEPLKIQQSATPLPSSPNDLPPVSHDTPNEENSSEENSSEEKDLSCPSPDEKTILALIWGMAPSKAKSRSSKKQVAAEWKKIKAADRPSEDDLCESFTAWAKSDDWTKDRGEFVPGLHLWFKNRKWEDAPEPSKGNTNNRTGQPLPSQDALMGGRTASILKLNE